MTAMFGSASTSQGGGIQPERHLSGQNEINIPNEALSVRERLQFITYPHLDYDSA